MTSHTWHRADQWSPTYAHLRAVLAAALGAGAALVVQRTDLLVLVAPLVMVVIWSFLTRPRQVPQRSMSIPTTALREGAWSRALIRTTHVPHAELLSSSLSPAPYVEYRPEHGAAVHLIDPGDSASGQTVSRTGFRPTRWGTREIGPALVAATSPWGAYRWGPVPVEALSAVVLPNPEVFDADAPAPHPRGLVGQHRSVRPGDGSEFASIRPFQWGDRLKRIHWNRSLRTGELHVTSSHADQDTHVAIVVDAHYDLGHSGGVDGRPSTLDHTVRAAAAISAHFLHQGDRVSLQVLSARTPGRVQVGTGRRHQRRVLETLARVQPRPQEELDARQLRRGLPAGTLVVMISALVSPDVLAQAAFLSRSGLAVVVIDALVDDVEPPGEQDAVAQLAWRIRMVEREQEVWKIRHQGVPVVPWAGAGSLDLVLRSLSRRGRAGVAR